MMFHLSRRHSCERSCDLSLTGSAAYGAKSMNVGMLVDNAFTDDQRVFRAASSLARKGFDLTVLAVQGPGLPEAESVDGVRIRRVFSPATFDVKRPSYLRSQAQRWAAERFSVLHCHDHWMLHLGVQIKRLCPETILIYDSHELFHRWPLNLAQDIDWFMKFKSIVVRKYLVWRERANARHLDYLITVNESIAQQLGEYFRLRTQPLVIRNVPALESYRSAGQLIRERFGIPVNHKVLVFIGAFLHARTLNVEAVIDEVGNAPELALVLISGEGSTKEEVVAHVQRRGYKNIFFHPRLAPGDIIAHLSSCDVGLVPTWNPGDLSYWLALDNKLFQYIMAELPVLATAQPEYRKVVERYGVGVCVNPDRPGAYLEGLRTIIGSYAPFKENVRRAKMVLNWELEQHTLLEFYRKLEYRVGLRGVAGSAG